MIPAYFVPKSQLPAILSQKHTDFPKLLQWVPRRLTAFVHPLNPLQLFLEFALMIGALTLLQYLPLLPMLFGTFLVVALMLDFQRKLAGNAKTLAPIPAAGEWLLALPLYFAIHTKSGWVFRIGIRYDDVDNYFEFPAFTLKRSQ